jgi:hypothetical protein
VPFFLPFKKYFSPLNFCTYVKSDLHEYQTKLFSMGHHDEVIAAIAATGPLVFLTISIHSNRGLIEGIEL